VEDLVGLSSTRVEEGLSLLHEMAPLGLSSTRVEECLSFVHESFSRLSSTREKCLSIGARRL